MHIRSIISLAIGCTVFSPVHAFQSLPRSIDEAPAVDCDMFDAGCSGVPGISMLQFDVTRRAMSQVELSETTAARMQLPNMPSLPKLDLSHMPKMQIPEMTMPNVHMPKMQMPDVQMPKLPTMPKMQMPLVDLRTLKLPHMQLPHIPLTHRGAHWSRGAAYKVISDALSSVGQNFQRLSHLRTGAAIGKDLTQKAAPCWTQPLWLLGATLYAIAAPFDAFAYYYAPTAVIAGVGTLKLPFVAFLAWATLEVRISWECAIGSFFCVCGSFLSLAVAPHGASTLVVNAPLDFLTPKVLTYLSVSVCSWALLVCGIFVAERKFMGMPMTGKAGCAVPLLTAWVYQVGKLFNAGMGLVAGSQSIMSREWEWLPACVVLSGLATTYLNFVGVKLQSTHIFLPMLAAFGALVTGFQSMALLGEFDAMSHAEALFWAAGVGIALAGAVLVGRSHQTESSPGGNTEESKHP